VWASVKLALDFLLEFARQRPCVVQDRTGELHTPEDLLEFAQSGYLGYDWNAEHTQVVKVQAENQWCSFIKKDQPGLSSGHAAG
jgi:hypothetical protein